MRSTTHDSRRSRYGQRTAWIGALLLALGTTLATAAEMVVLSTDFQTGYFSSIATSPPWVPQIDRGSTCADAVVRAFGDRIYFVGRFGCDFIQVVDPTAGYTTLKQFSTGNGTNPHDIEILDSTRAYVSLYDAAHVLEVDPRDGSVLGQVDVSAFADADGLPECDGMVRVGGRLFVALQRLDRPGGFVASNASQVAVIDLATGQLVDADSTRPGTQAIELTGRNPFTDLRWDPVRKRVMVCEAGNFGVLDGGCEWLDPLTLQAEGFFITEATLGGDLNAVVVRDDCVGYAIVNDASFNTRLQRFDHCAGTLLETCFSTNGFTLADLEFDPEGRLWIADRDLLAPGVRIVEAPGCAELTAGPIGFGLPPQDLVLRADCPGLPTDTAPRPGTDLVLEAWPNPFNPALTLGFTGPPRAAIALDVFDTRGRHVVRLRARSDTGGAGRVVWRGRDAAGRPVPSGVYVVRLRAGHETRTRQVTLIR